MAPKSPEPSSPTPVAGKKASPSPSSSSPSKRFSRDGDEERLISHHGDDFDDGGDAGRKLGVCRQVSMCSAMLSGDGGLIFMQLSMLPCLQTLGVPVSLVTLPGCISGPASMLLLPLVGWLSDGGDRRKKPLAAAASGLFLLAYAFIIGGCLLHVSSSSPGAALAGNGSTLVVGGNESTTVIPDLPQPSLDPRVEFLPRGPGSSQLLDGRPQSVSYQSGSSDDSPLSSSSTPQQNDPLGLREKRSSDDLSSDDSRTPTSLLGGEFLGPPDLGSPSPLLNDISELSENSSGGEDALRGDDDSLLDDPLGLGIPLGEDALRGDDDSLLDDPLGLGIPLGGLLAILGFVFVDMGNDVGNACVRSLVLATSHKTQHVEMLVVGVVMSALGGCLAAILGLVDVTSFMAVDLGLDAVPTKTLLQCAFFAVLTILCTSITVLASPSHTPSHYGDDKVLTSQSNDVTTGRQKKSYGALTEEDRAEFLSVASLSAVHAELAESNAFYTIGNVIKDVIVAHVSDFEMSSSNVVRPVGLSGAIRQDDVMPEREREGGVAGEQREQPLQQLQRQRLRRYHHHLHQYQPQQQHNLVLSENHVFTDTMSSVENGNRSEAEGHFLPTAGDVDQTGLSSPTLSPASNMDNNITQPFSTSLESTRVHYDDNIDDDIVSSDDEEIRMKIEQSPTSPSVDGLPVHCSDKNPGFSTSVSRKTRQLALVCLSMFFMAGAWQSFNISCTDYLGKVMYQGDPEADPNSQSYLAYQQGMETGSRGVLLLNITYVLVNMLQRKLLAVVGPKDEYLAVCGTLVALLLLLRLTDNEVVFYVLNVVLGAFRSVMYTVPFILANDIAQDNSPCGGQKNAAGGGGSGGGSCGSKVASTIALVTTMIPLSFLVVSSLLGPLLYLTADPASPISFSLACTAAAALVFAFT